MAQVSSSSGEASYECKFFYEDEVVRYVAKQDKLEFGLVIENSEYVSSDENSDSDDDSQEERKVKSGQVRVTWYPKGKEEILSENRIHLANRSLMPGDVVAIKEGQREKRCGYCQHVKTVACVRILGTDQILYNIDSEDLKPLQEFDVDLAVALDNWVGMVRSFKLKLTLRTKDGSVCVMDDEHASELRNLHEKRAKSSEFSNEYNWYVGQVLGGTLSNFKNAKWIEGDLERVTNELRAGIRSKKPAMVVATVENVEVISLNVQWQCQAGVGDTAQNGSLNSGFEQPKYLIDGNDLKRVHQLNVFEPCTLQLGDRSYYYYKSSDLVLTQKEWARLQCTTLLPDQLSKGQTGTHAAAPAADSDEWESLDSESDGHEEPLLRVQSNASSRSSLTDKHHSTGRNSISVNTKPLKKKKLRRAKTKSEEVWQISAKPGDRLVVETVCTMSWVDVYWQDGTLEKAVPSRNLYPVNHIDDKEFFPGDFVVHAESSDVSFLDYGVVQRVASAERIATVQWFRTCTAAEAARPEVLQVTDVSVYDVKEHPDFRFRPGSVVVRVANFGDDQSHSACPAGQVLDNQLSGQVKVWWAPGTISLCWPQELYRIGDYDSDPGELWGDQGDFDSKLDEHEDGESDSSWETESETSLVDGEVVPAEAKAVRDLDLNKAGRILLNMKKAVGALGNMMRRLENISKDTPVENADTSEVLSTMLGLYKKCRFLDRLLNTSFFQESSFDEMLEKIPQQKTSSTAASSSSAEAPAACAATAQESEPLDERMNQRSAALRLGYLIEQQLKKMQQHLKDYGMALQQRVQNVKENGAEKDECRAGVTASSSSSSELAEVDNQNDLGKTDTAETEIEQCGPCLEEEKRGEFSVVETAPTNHKFRPSPSQPVNGQHFQKALRHELKILGSSLPSGIHVKTFEDRMDLFSVMIEGPANTPYEGGLFFFDIQLPNDYPRVPPVCHYWSYCSERLNPNLYEEGRVCVSLLGTWSGKGVEVWGPGSNLLQVLVSIQGLILVAEPYYNEAGYERQRGSAQANENSRLYNEMVLLKLLQAMSRLVRHPPDLWRTEILEFIKKESSSMLWRYRSWMHLSGVEDESASKDQVWAPPPVFPLLPVSRGFCLTLRKALQMYEKNLEEANVGQSSPNPRNGHSSSEGSR